jgi:hypothetical protein
LTALTALVVFVALFAACTAEPTPDFEATVEAVEARLLQALTAVPTPTAMVTQVPPAATPTRAATPTLVPTWTPESRPTETPTQVPPTPTPTPVPTPTPTATPGPMNIEQSGVAESGLRVTVEQIRIMETEFTTLYTVSCLLENPTTDTVIDEGAFKAFFSDGSSEPQYGDFNRLFPQASLRRSYTWSLVKPVTMSSVVYDAGFFSGAPPRGRSAGHSRRQQPPLLWFRMKYRIAIRSLGCQRMW